MLYAMQALLQRRLVMAEEVIRANRFEVVDGEGRPRVVLGTQGETSGLVLLDGNGQSVAELAVGDDTGATSLSLYDLRGSVRASLDLDPEGPKAGDRDQLIDHIAHTPDLSLVQTATRDALERTVGIFPRRTPDWPLSDHAGVWADFVAK